MGGSEAGTAKVMFPGVITGCVELPRLKWGFLK